MNDSLRVLYWPHYYYHLQIYRCQVLEGICPARKELRRLSNLQLVSKLIMRWVHQCQGLHQQSTFLESQAKEVLELSG